MGIALLYAALVNKTINIFLRFRMFSRSLTQDTWRVLFGGFHKRVPSRCAVILGDRDCCRGAKIWTVWGGHGNAWLLDIHKLGVHDLAVDLHHSDQVFVSVVILLPFRSWLNGKQRELGRTVQHTCMTSLYTITVRGGRRGGEEGGGAEEDLTKKQLLASVERSWSERCSIG